MPEAYMLLNVDTGREDEVLREVRKYAINGAKTAEANAVYGVYDIVAKVTADNMDSLKHALSYGFSRIGGIRNKMSLISTED